MSGGEVYANATRTDSLHESADNEVYDAKLFGGSRDNERHFSEYDFEGEMAFARYAESKCNLIEKGDYVSFTQTALKGRFGKLPPDAEEMLRMKDFVRKLASKVYSTQGKLGKAVMRYVLFLR